MPITFDPANTVAVPAPTASDASKALLGNMTWGTPTTASSLGAVPNSTGSANITIPANYGAYIVDSFEVVSTFALELADGALMEIG